MALMRGDQREPHRSGLARWLWIVVVVLAALLFVLTLAR
jgi:hypothetical protein